MGVEAKYYTPEIEEFHVGFEYEFKHPDIGGLPGFGWLKYNNPQFNPEYEDYCLAKLGRDSFRVKCLDKEDIEECGWKASGTESDLYSINWIENPTERKNAIWLRQFSENRIQIIDSRNTRHISLFYGAIKNKSELKRLMKQLGICSK